MEVRFAVKGDAGDCVQFHNRLYGKNRTVGQWLWEFVNSHHIDDEIPYVIVKEHGRIVGTQGLIPIRMIDKEGIFLTAKSEDTLIDPAMRGRGLFSQMFELLFEYAKDHNISSIWGFTPAVKPFLKIGFRVLGSTSQLLRPCSPMLAGALSGYFQSSDSRMEKLKTLGYQIGFRIAPFTSSLISTFRNGVWPRSRQNEVKLRTLSEAPAGADLTCQHFVRQWGGATIYRDQQYLHWRIFQNPYIRSLIVGGYVDDVLCGWIICSLDKESVGYIVDVLVGSATGDAAFSEAILNLLITEAVSRLRKMGALGIRLWSASKHAFDARVVHIARRHGFFHLGRHGSPIVIHHLGADPSTFRANHDHWFFTRLYTEGMLG